MLHTLASLTDDELWRFCVAYADPKTPLEQELFNRFEKLLNENEDLYYRNERQYYEDNNGDDT